MGSSQTVLVLICQAKELRFNLESQQFSTFSIGPFGNLMKSTDQILLRKCVSSCTQNHDCSLERFTYFLKPRLSTFLVCLLAGKYLAMTLFNTFPWLTGMLKRVLSEFPLRAETFEVHCLA